LIFCNAFPFGAAVRAPITTPMSRLLSFAALLACLMLAGGALAAPDPLAPLPIDPRLKLGKLENGLTYYIRRNARPAQRVELRLVVNAGSVLEDDDQRGVAHFVEHMAFNGSTHFRQHELQSFMESIGMRVGADLNAFTYFDATIYHLPIPLDRPGNLERGFQVLEDWAHGLQLGTREIEDERAIILEEKRLRSGFGMRQRDATVSLLANGSRYGERAVIGTDDAILHDTPDAVRRFYRDWYRPDLMAVIVVGDVDPLEAERLVRRHFAGLRMPAHPRPRPSFAVPPIEKAQGVVLTDKEAPGPEVELIYSTFQRKPAATVGEYRDVLIRSLFARMMNARLSRLTNSNAPPFIGESPLPFGARLRAYTARTGFTKIGVEGPIGMLATENQRVRQFGFDAAELEAARRPMLASYEHAYQARDTQESDAVLADYVNHFLRQQPIPGVDNEYAWVQAFLPGITLEEVNAWAAANVPATPPKLVIYTTNANANAGDGKAPPTGEQLVAMAEAGHKLPVAKRVEQALPGVLMADKPAPGRILQQSDDAALGLTRLTLSNGVKVVLKPTAFSKDAVRMQGVRPGGMMLFPDADKTLARYACASQGAMGVGAYSPLDLQRMLAGTTAAVGASMGPYADIVAGGSRTQDIETLLQLTYLYVTNPRRDERLFRLFVNRTAEQVRNSMAAPEARFAEARLQTVFGKHPRVELMSRPEDIEALDLDRAQALYRSRMGSAKGMTFFFVGDFDPEAIKPLLARYLATLPVDDVALAYRDPQIRQVPGVLRRVVAAGVEQKSVVAYDFGGDTAYSKAEATVFRALVDVLNLRIAEDLRERQKLIYAGNATGEYANIPRGSYALSINLPTAPQNVDKLEAALWASIGRLQAQGPSAAELNKVKQAMLQGYRRNLRENDYWMQYLRGAELEGSDPHDILTVEQRIGALTEADVQAAARRFLNPNQYVEMVQVPESQAETKVAGP
jgi:zinc protease